MELHQTYKSVVVLCDEAQALPAESLEALRLLTNLETETKKLLQVVLFGQPELDQRLKHKSLRQLKQRISFSYNLAPLNRGELSTYLYHRIAVAGYTFGNLFTRSAMNRLYRASRGMPRIINLAAHKALLVAYGRGDTRVNVRAMRKALAETEGTMRSSSHWLWGVVALGLAVCAVVALLVV